MCRIIQRAIQVQLLLALNLPCVSLISRLKLAKMSIHTESEYQKLFSALQAERKRRNLWAAKLRKWWKETSVFSNDDQRWAEWEKMEEIEPEKNSD